MVICVKHGRAGDVRFSKTSPELHMAQKVLHPDDAIELVSKANAILDSF